VVPSIRSASADYSEFRRVFFITTKSEVADCLRKFLKEVKTAGHVTKVLVSDGGKEFNCETVQKVLKHCTLDTCCARPMCMCIYCAV